MGYPIGGGFRGGCCELQARTPEASIVLGRRVGVNNGFLVIAASSVSIGDRCLLGRDVTILDFDAHGIAPEERRSSSGTCRPVRLEDNVWIGNGVLLLKGVHLGADSVVAAGSVVVGGVYPPGAILGGHPARILGHVRDRQFKEETP